MFVLAFLLIFVAFPIVELTLLFQLGVHIGWAPTLALVFGAGLLGAGIARLEGWRAALRVRQQLASGVLPAAEMFDGLLIGLAGVLLVLPGILSDILGLVLLLPPVRTLVRRGLMRWARGRFQVHVVSSGPNHGDGSPLRRDQIIDARVVDARVID